MSNDKKYKGEIEEGKKSDSSLYINDGVNQLPQINPNVNKFKRKETKELSVEEYVNGIFDGNIKILSKAITLVESKLIKHNEIAQKVIEACLPKSGNSVRIGITGVPGVGKSTFIEALGMLMINNGKKLAVLAVDPSSERSGGSILGDKTRMEELSASKHAFIRPSPSAGTLGGVARKTHEIIVLCEAAGFDTVFIETVGVGQSETTVHSMVDFFLLLMLPGAGDELQGIKRGIMEMADSILINKAEGDNAKKALIAQGQYQNALHLFPPTQSGWQPKVLTCSALKKTGLNEVIKLIEDYLTHTNANGYFRLNRNQQSKYWMYETINQQIKDRFYKNHNISSLISETEKKVLDGEMSSFVAANYLLDLYNKSDDFNK